MEDESRQESEGCSDLKIPALENTSNIPNMKQSANKLLRLQGMLKRNRSKLQKPVHKCSECDKTFNLGISLRLHMADHAQLRNSPSTKPIQETSNLSLRRNVGNKWCCQICKKSFSGNSKLIDHLRIHTGDRPFKCAFCEKRFKQVSHLKVHTRLHTGERPYKCPKCSTAFRQSFQLQYHQSRCTVKLNPNPPSLKCRPCFVVLTRCDSNISKTTPLPSASLPDPFLEKAAFNMFALNQAFKAGQETMVLELEADSNDDSRSNPILVEFNTKLLTHFLL